jgi:hypothetical protein
LIFFFYEGTHIGGEDETHVKTGITPFQFACKQFGQKSVIQEVMDQIGKHDPVATVPSIIAVENIAPTVTVTVESSILLSAVTDETIHLDGLYLLLRRDPTALLPRLQQLLEGEEGEEEVEGRKSSDNNSNNNCDGGNGSDGNDTSVTTTNNSTTNTMTSSNNNINRTDD